MSDYLGDFVEDATVNYVFTTNAADGGVEAPSSAFEVADYKIYKNTLATQKSTITGISITTDNTGSHGISIDTSNNMGDAGFWETGNDYFVVLDPDETIDSQIIEAALFQFSIQNRFVNITAEEVVIAMKAMTGITEGGTWTWEKVLKITTAFAAGNWRVKPTDASKQELMDAENKTTVILEQDITKSPTVGNKYRNIVVKI